jgi:hypothetical protein
LIPPVRARRDIVALALENVSSVLAAGSDQSRLSPGASVGLSARRPAAELLRVAYYPDVLDPVACEAEREHRDGGAVLLGCQARLAVDRAFQEGHVAGRTVGDFDPGAGDLLAAFDGVQERNGKAAAVGDCRGVRVEQADQGGDVFGFPCDLEGLDDVGLPGRRGRGSLRPFRGSPLLS